MKTQISILTAALLASSLGFAQDEERDYDASISLGYVATSGNTDTTTFNTEALYTLRQNRWTHNAKFQALGSQENGTAKAERYYLEDKSDFSLQNEDHYLYAKGTYTDDRFSGYNYQADLSAGYGLFLFNLDTLKVQGFTGVGYRQSDLDVLGSEGEVIYSLGENLNWEISDNAKLLQSFSTDIGNELTVSKFEVGLEANIIDRIATKISFQARNISEVPAGRKKTDTLTSVSLVYTF